MALSVFASLESGEIRAHRSNYLDVVIALGLGEGGRVRLVKLLYFI